MQSNPHASVGPDKFSFWQAWPALYIVIKNHKLINVPFFFETVNASQVCSGDSTTCCTSVVPIEPKAFRKITATTCRKSRQVIFNSFYFIFNSKTSENFSITFNLRTGFYLSSIRQNTDPLKWTQSFTLILNPLYLLTTSSQVILSLDNWVLCYHM